MSAKSTGVWVLIAAVLFAFIFFYQRHRRPNGAEPQKVLPSLNAAAVSEVQVLPRGRTRIEVRRTNEVWRLLKPLVYPGQASSINTLLATLQQLVPAAFIAEAELTNRFSVDEEYGFADPQVTLTLQQGDGVTRLRLGKATAPGDQVYLQVVGVEGVYVVDAGLLNLIPRTAGDWRDTTLLSLTNLLFDRVALSKGSKVFELQRDATNRFWRMTYPIAARADNAKIESALQQLGDTRIEQFVSDEPRTDLEALGLQPPEFELSLAQGLTPAALLQVGKSPTNDARLAYARRDGGNTIVAVPLKPLAPWRGTVNDFRDPHLLTLTVPVDAVEVHGEGVFSLEHQTNETWRVMPDNLLADGGLVKQLLSTLTELKISEFVKDFVPEQKLPDYGFTGSARHYVLKSLSTNSFPAELTPLAELSFGGTNEDKVFARRTDETSVYGVKATDVQRLPSASWQFRDRRLWSFTPDDIVQVTIHEHGKTRQLLRRGPYRWSLATNSVGMLEELPVEETVRGLGQLSAGVWVARGASNLAQFGFSDASQQVTLEPRTGNPVTIQFGAEALSGIPYAAVTLEGQPWIFEFPPDRSAASLCRDVARYLAVPSEP